MASWSQPITLKGWLIFSNFQPSWRFYLLEKEGSRNSTPCAHVLFQYMLGFQGVFIFPNFQCESQNSWLCWFTRVVGYFQGPLATNFPISVADVSNDLKNISQIGSFLQVGVKIQNI